MTTLPTPETLRSRAAVALACAESATDTGRFTTDAARILTETQRAVALAAYARELLTIAAQLEPAAATDDPVLRVEGFELTEGLGVSVATKDGES